MQSRRTAVFTALLVVMPLLASCDFYPIRSKSNTLSDMQDRQQQLTREDFRDMNKASKLLPDGAKAEADLGAPPIPELSQVLAAPRPPKIANTKLVTLSVTDDVPLRDVLFELGRLANVDIEVGSGLDTQGINLRATERPFNEVIERIADLGNLRYSQKGSSIRVERDLPYLRNYTIDFINSVRSSNSSYTLSTSILSSASGGGGGDSSGSSSGSSGDSSSGGSTSGTVGTSGSTSSINSSAESDLWSSLEASITEILNYNPEDGGSGGDAAATTGAAEGSASGANATGTSGTSGFTINRQAGVISVNATERQHEMVQRFLSLIGRNASGQVLIEAKIVEVSLEDQFLSGVDWNSLIGNAEGISISPGSFSPTGTSALSLSGNSTIIGLDGLGLDTVVALTERFGTTRTLSSPRLSAINNQQAILTFARNEVFYVCDITPPTTVISDSTSTPTPGTADCSPNSVPIGIILNILPSINLDTQEVTLNVRPTLTRKVGDALNPQQAIIAQINGTDYDGTGVQQTTPIIEVREIDSIMKVKSGGIMIIGGLMEDSSTTENKGIPGLSEMPILGSAFKSRDELYGKRELIIFIKATIVNSDGNSGPVDRAVSDRFTTDPRPLFKPKIYDAE